MTAPIVLINPGVHVRIVSMDKTAAQVNVLDGEARGLTPWVRLRDIR